METEKKGIRCGNCNRLLAKGTALDLSIKCPRCKTINHISMSAARANPEAGWMGGKSILARRIIELLPDHACYVEPFAGAAWVLFRKTESKSEVLNDINRNITTLYRVVKYHLEEFIRYFKWSLVTRDEFDRLRAANADTLTDIQRAARFYYLQHCGFNGRVVSPTFRYATKTRPKLNLLRIKEHLSEAHLRLSRVYIECLPYQK